MKAVVRKTARVQHRLAPRGNERRLVTQHPRRRILHLAAGTVALPVISRFASAQAYPARPITMVVPIAAGSSADVSGRLVAERMGTALGQPIIVENVPGPTATLASVVSLAQDPMAIRSSLDFKVRMF